MYRSIVVGTDGSHTARSAVEHAVAMSKASGAPLHLVTACPPPTSVINGPESAAMMGAAYSGSREVVEEAQRSLQDLASQLEAEQLKVTTHVCQGEAADAIIDVAKRTEADLIVVGSKGMHGARRFMGSVPNRVSHRASTSVLIVRTD